MKGEGRGGEGREGEGRGVFCLAHVGYPTPR